MCACVVFLILLYVHMVPYIIGAIKRPIDINIRIIKNRQNAIETTK